MVEHLIKRLLDEAVNTSCKLALVLFFAENRRFAASPKKLAQRLGRDPWSMDTAVRELMADEILAQADQGVVYRPAVHWQEALDLLHRSYDDPFHRDAILSYVNELERYAPYGEEFFQQRVVAA